jgi:integrase
VKPRSAKRKSGKFKNKEISKMSVYKRGNKWWYTFVFDGVRVQRSTKVGNKNDARDIERGAWTQLARGEVGLENKAKLKDLSIDDLLDALKADFKLRGKDTVRNLSTLELARDAFKDLTARTLTPVAVDSFIEKRLADGDRPATINRKTELIRQAFKLALERGEVRSMPKIRHLSEQGNARQGFFAEAEFRAVYDHLPADIKDFALFAYLTGWRKAEVASLSWKDVSDGVIILRSENSKNGEARSVIIDGELSELIDRRKDARKIKTDDGVLLASTVFHREDGSPIQEIRKSWASATKKAGVPGKLFHDLRRTAVRNMVRAGCPERVAMSISGHKTRSIFDRYNITSETDLREAMQRVQRHHERERQKVVSVGRG